MGHRTDGEWSMMEEQIEHDDGCHHDPWWWRVIEEHWLWSIMDQKWLRIMDEIWNGACGIAWIMDHDGSLITMVTWLSMEHIAIEDIEHDVDRKHVYFVALLLLSFCASVSSSQRWGDTHLLILILILVLLRTRLYWYYSSIHSYNTLRIPNNTSVMSTSPLVGGLLISPHASRIIYLLSTETLPNSSTSAAERGWQLAAGSYWQLDGAFFRL